MPNKLWFIIKIFFIVSCNNLNIENSNVEDEDCTNFTCQKEEPQNATLIIRFTRNLDNTDPIIFISTGYWETHIDIKKIATDTIPQYMSYVDVEVPIDRFYTVYTYYLKNQDTIIAIDGKFVYKNKYVDCQTDCWEIKNSEFSIRLK